MDLNGQYIDDEYVPCANCPNRIHLYDDVVYDVAETPDRIHTKMVCKECNDAIDKKT